MSLHIAGVILLLGTGNDFFLLWKKNSKYKNGLGNAHWALCNTVFLISYSVTVIYIYLKSENFCRFASSGKVIVTKLQCYLVVLMKQLLCKVNRFNLCIFCMGANQQNTVMHRFIFMCVYMQAHL
jgi:hypothetical protein